MTDQTSADVKFEPKYAGFWRRFGAFILDTIILSLVTLVVGWSILLFAGFTIDQEYLGESDISAFDFVNIIGFFIGSLYFVILEGSSMQATFGKRAFDLKVTNLSGGRITVGKAIGRYISKIVSGMTLFIGFLMVVWTDKKQGLHDMMTETLVIVDR